MRVLGAVVVAMALVATQQTRRRSCAEHRAEVDRLMASPSPPLGLQIPRCEPGGTYAAVQCKGSVCYCSTTDFRGLNYYVNRWEADTMNCNCARAESADNGQENIRCLDNGNFSPIQCDDTICYCVDSNGSRVPGGTESDVSKQNDLDCGNA